MAQDGAVPEQFVMWLWEIVYTQENVWRANEYLRTVRGLDPAKLRVPWVLTGPDPTPFMGLSAWKKRPDLYADCLFIPIPDLSFPAGNVLAGFDIRYCGPRQDRARFLKEKRRPDIPLIYNVHEALTSPYGIVTESAIDSETIRQLGFCSISPLTALGTPPFTIFCHAMFERIFIAYDNDSNGIQQARRLVEHAEKAGPDVASNFVPIIYRGGDPNDALRKYGPDMLRQSLEGQVY